MRGKRVSRAVSKVKSATNQTSGSNAPEIAGAEGHSGKGITIIEIIVNDVRRRLSCATICQKKAHRVKSMFEQALMRIKQTGAGHVNDVMVESILQYIHYILQPYFRVENVEVPLEARILEIVNAYAGHRALVDAEIQIQNLLHLYDSTRPVVSDAIIDEEDATDRKFMCAELMTLLEQLQGRYNGHELQIVKEMLAGDPRMSFNGSNPEAIIQSRTKQKAIKRLEKYLMQEQNKKMTTLPNDCCLAAEPVQSMEGGHFGQIFTSTIIVNDQETEVALQKFGPFEGEFPSNKQIVALHGVEDWLKLRHPNIVQLLGTCTLGKQLYLVMDERNLSLEDLLYESELHGGQTHKLSYDEKLSILRGTIRGLAYLHSEGFLHGNLEPSNVTFDRSTGRVKLVNFSVATNATIDPHCISDAGMGLASPVYHAPELLEGTPQWTTRADIYAYGLLTWEILHHQAPFEGLDSEGNLADKILDGKRPPISDDANITLWLVRLIEACWQQTPEQRPTAAEVLEKFETRKSHSRKSTKIIQSVINTFAKGRRQGDAIHSPTAPKRSQTSAAKGPTKDVIHHLMDELDKEDPRDVLRLLGLLRTLLSEEQEGVDLEGVRAEALKRGLLQHLQRILEMQSSSKDECACALWVLRFALLGNDSALKFREEALSKYKLGHLLVDRMKEFQDSASLQAAACGACLTLAHSPPVNKIKLCQELGIGHEIIFAMDRHRTDAEIQKLGCSAIQNLSVNNRNCRILGQELHAGQYIITAMREHRENAEVQRFACSSLQNLAVKTREALVQELNVGKEILEAMRMHRSNAIVQKVAMGAINNLSIGNDRNKEIFGQELNIGQEIMMSLRTHRHDPSVQETAFGLLWTLAVNDRNEEILVQELRIGNELIDAMREHRHHSGVQKMACVALNNLSVNERNKEILCQKLDVGREIIEAMHAHRENADVQKAACVALNMLAINSQNSKTLCQDLHVARDIIDAMRALRSHAEVQQVGCVALATLARNERNRKILGQELKVGKEIISAMRTHEGNALVQQYGCGAIRNLSVDARNQVIFGQELGVGKYVVAAMNAHRDRDNVQETACTAFWKLANNEQNRIILAQDLHIGTTLVKAMLAHQDRGGVQKYASGVIRKLAAVDDNNKETLGKVHEINIALLTALQTHKKNAEVEEQVLGALLNLGLNDCNKTLFKNNLEIGESVLTVMRLFKDNSTIQTYGCGLLRDLAATEANKRFLGKDLNAGAELIIAMRAHPDNAELQRNACGAIQNLAVDDINEEILCVALDIGKDIIAAMRKHPTHSSVQESACGALRNLAVDDRHQEILCQKHDAGSEILCAMREHHDDSELLKTACGALRNLAGDERNREILGQELNAGTQILAAMCDFPDNPGMQEKALAALEMLALNERNEVTFCQDLRVASEVLAAMRTHHEDAGVQEKACGVLWSLSVNDRNKEILGQELGIGRMVLAAMRAHSNQAGLQRRACGTLRNLSMNKRNKEMLGRELNAGSEILTAMRTHRQDENVQLEACGALRNLSGNKKNKVILGLELNAGLEVLKTMRMHQRNERIQNEACNVLRHLAKDVNVQSTLCSLGAQEQIAEAQTRFPRLKSPKQALSRLTTSY